MDFLSLPVVMIENIFSFLSYDEIAKNRLVSKAFNDICSRMLNRGFLMIERRHALALKSVKAQLPRRESERKYHPLARHNDILTSIETRISMLNMTYTKFIDHGMCCFIPGKVIDEIQRVLHMLDSVKSPPRAHEALQELRDISSMAIEHFDDKISPAFRKKMHEAAMAPVVQRPTAAVLAPLVLQQELDRLRRRSHQQSKCALYLAKQYKAFSRRMFEYEKIAWRQRNTIRNMIRKSRQTDATIADLKKRIEECDVKYNEITQANQAVGGKAISAASGEVSSARHFSSQIKLDLSVLPIGTNKRNATKSVLSNIKPRTPVIKLPSLSEDNPSESRQSPVPSTSNQSCIEMSSSPKTRSQCAMAKIRGLTNEIRQLSHLSKSQMAKSLEAKIKRAAIADDGNECKKAKLE